MTHIEKQREVKASIDLQVKEILGITNDEYKQLHFDLAFEWLLERDAERKFWMTKTRAFWDWWKIVFNMVNQDILLKIDRDYKGELHTYTKVSLLEAFKKAHIKSELYPTDKVYNSINRQYKLLSNEA